MLCSVVRSIAQSTGSGDGWRRCHGGWPEEMVVQQWNNVQAESSFGSKTPTTFSPNGVM